jgi:hypothetical protein
MNVRSLLLLVGALALFAPTVFAQNEDQKAGARNAADEGGKAFEAGNFEQSLDLFSRAESLVHALPHLLYIARSHEKLGQLVKAREAYLKMTREKLADGAPDAFKDAQTKAQTELAALEPRIPKVTISLKGDGAASAKVQMDGADVPPALVGIPHPVDPGQHTFVATGDGVKSEEKSVDVKEGGSETVELELKATTAPGGPAAGGGEGSATLDPAQATKGANGLRIASYVALGVGVVGLIGGTVFALQSSSKRDDAKALCNNPDGSCPADKQGQINSLDDDADSAKTLATVGFVVGGVGIAAGVTMFILSNKKKSEPAAMYKPRVTPWVGFGSAGLSGSF